MLLHPSHGASVRSPPPPQRACPLNVSRVVISSLKSPSSQISISKEKDPEVTALREEFTGMQETMAMVMTSLAHREDGAGPSNPKVRPRNLSISMVFEPLAKVPRTVAQGAVGISQSSSLY